MPSKEEAAGSAIRLDAFLKNAGILKRRSLAQSYCEAGAVSVNGHPAKSGRLIRVGDRIQIDSWNRRLLLLVRDIPKKGRNRGEACFEALADERKPAGDLPDAEDPEPGEDPPP